MSNAQPPLDKYDYPVLRHAEQVTAAATEEYIRAVGTERAVVISAPAGAGKTGLVGQVVGRIRKHEIRIAVATPTNQQAFDLVLRLARRHADELIAFVPAQGISLPPSVAMLKNVCQIKAGDAKKQNVVVGTVKKLGDAYSSGALTPFDALLIDEAYQVDSSRYYGIAGLAATHMLVGDPGQLSPFSIIENPDYWRGLPEDPLQTAVGVLLRNHPSMPLTKLPISRRLDNRAVAVAEVLYPDLTFNSALLPGSRELVFLSAEKSNRQVRLLDIALDHAALEGWAHLELPAAPVLTTDPGMIEFICLLVGRLISRCPVARCELWRNWNEIPANRIAVGVSHNDQKNLIRAHLDAAGHAGVVVETANKLQGLEFDIVVAWHPMAGLPDPDPFHLDPGRLCVLLTRHRHACIVLSRAGDRALLDGVPPPTPAYLGWDSDPLLDGWDIHRSVFLALERHRFILDT